MAANASFGYYSDRGSIRPGYLVLIEHAKRRAVPNSSGPLSRNSNPARSLDNETLPVAFSSGLELFRRISGSSARTEQQTGWRRSDAQILAQRGPRAARRHSAKQPDRLP